jgi:hypothetical protein
MSVYIRRNKMGNYYYAKAKELFGGKVVGAFTVEVNTDTGEETIKPMGPMSKFSGYGEEFMGIRFEMPDGSFKGMIIKADEEGNGPGDFDVIDLVRVEVGRKKDAGNKKEIGKS